MSTKIATKLTKNNGVIYYSLVEKESEKKLRFN